MKRQLPLVATRLDHARSNSIHVNDFVNTLPRTFQHWLWRARVLCALVGALSVGSALQAQDRELHVVGIYQAGESSSNHSEGVASIEVNRPGKTVTLLLSAYEPVLWQVTVDAGTTVEKIIATGYYRQRVQGVAPEVPVVTQSYDEGTGYLYIGSAIDSSTFLSSVPSIHALTGLEISSFHGGYSQNPSTSFVIDSVQDDPRLRSDYPQPVPIEQLPDLHFEMSFQRDNGVLTQSYSLAGPQGARFLLPSGMRVIADAGKRFYYGAEQQTVIKIDTLTGSVQEIPAQLTAPEGWPMGTAFDSARNRILVVNLSGEGGLYGYSPAEDRWSFVASMQNRDFDSIEYRAANDSLYVVGLTHDSPLVIHQLRADGTYVGPAATLPSQPNNVEPGGYRSEIVAAGDNYLVVLLGPQSWYNREPADYRMYLVDLRNGQVQLTYRQIGAPQNKPPTVHITSPDADTTVEVGAEVHLLAEASDSDGTVQTVQFFGNGQSLGFGTRIEDSTFGKTWTASSPGEYNLTAEAMDAEGLRGVSSPVHITVHGNQRPVVRITSPASGSSFHAGVVVPLKAEASDRDGTVRSVEFLVDGTSLGIATHVDGTLFSQDWTTPANGTYMIVAKAIDDQEAVATSNPIQIIVRENRPPIVRITSPTNGATLHAGVKSQLGAEAYDFDGKVKSVEFFANDKSVGSAASLGGIMFRLDWTTPEPGSYSLTAKATDLEGATKVSGAVQVTITDAPIIATRQLPKFYRAGGRLRARLLVDPGSDVRAYTVEDQPPAGWIVTRVTQGGTFDPATGLVKFGPFADGRRRILAYQLSVPESATGIQTFSGHVLADGVDVPVGGDQTIAPVGEPRKTGIKGLVLRPTLLRGDILAPIPAEVPAANVQIWISDDSTRPAFSVRTDNDGRFQVDTVAGTIHVNVPALPADQSNLLPNYTHPPTEAKTLDVKVEANQVTDVTIDLAARTTVGEARLIYTVDEVTLSPREGLIPIAMIHVTAKGTARTSGWTNPRLRPRGTLADGTVELDFVAVPPDAAVLPMLSPLSATVDVAIPANFRGVRVFAETNSKEVFVQPPPPANTGISGRVIADVPGPRAPQPLANAVVEVDEIPSPTAAANPRPLFHWTGKTDADGQFTVSTYPGSYRVVARQLDSAGNEFGSVTVEVVVQDGAFSEVLLWIRHAFR